MKRYLIYLAIVAVSSSIFFSKPIPTGGTALADTTKTTTASKPTAHGTTPAPKSAVAAAPAAATTVKQFDPNDKSTWPTCADNQYVRADNGQCADNQAAAIVTANTAAAAPTAAVAGCGDNSYANYIYSHESGCQLYNPNSSSGACGLGQANPCSKLTAVCPNLDYACENDFFTGYANSRYGGWAGAYSFWVNNHWW